MICYTKQSSLLRDTIPRYVVTYKICKIWISAMKLMKMFIIMRPKSSVKADKCILVVDKIVKMKIN